MHTKKRYLIVGTGGTGGCIGGYLAADGQDVTFLARGNHLQAMREKGLMVHTPSREIHLSPVHACTIEEYTENPDVIFLCVKGYSLEDTIPLLERVATPNTIIIPILNIYGTGGRLAKQLPGLQILDGCMYIVAYISAPGEITTTGSLFRVVYGRRDHTCPPTLQEIAQDLRHSGIETIVSENIQRDAFQKYVCISAMASAGAYFDADMGTIRSTPHMRALYIQLTQEMDALAKAQGIFFPEDVLKQNLEILDNCSPDSTSSMQKDLKKGGASEIDGLILEPVRMGKKYGVPVPAYEKVAAHFSSCHSPNGTYPPHI